jgi:two-component system OmpR family sensor kinase
LRRFSSLRWRLVAWVTGALLLVLAVVFVAVYEQTGSQLRSQIDHDVAGDVSQLSQAVRTLKPRSSQVLLSEIRRYVSAQPFTGTSSLLFAAIPGYGTVSNHPELFGGPRPDDAETAAEQDRENALGRALLSGPVGLGIRQTADVGPVRVDERVVASGAGRIRVGAGEPLVIVARAERSVARSLAIAGALAVALALLASYLAGALVSSPLRGMARVAARVDDGDLRPRMNPPRTASEEIRVLAETFNHMLDRLSEAFAAQRDFIADASHELRTPLTVIRGQLEVLAATDRPSSEDVRHAQRLVSAEVGRTSRLVDDMLLLARSERRDFLHLGEIDLEPFVTDLWTATSLDRERRFELGELARGTLTADPDRLAQALRNLIRNAIEHTSEPDGLVRLEVVEQPAGRVRFAVLDDGPGIEPHQRARIFERFHRTDHSRARKTGGAGLGLAIVQAIVQAHGGSIHVGDTPRGGARVEFELPGLRAEPETPVGVADSRPA